MPENRFGWLAIEKITNFRTVWHQNEIFMNNNIIGSSGRQSSLNLIWLKEEMTEAMIVVSVFWSACVFVYGAPIGRSFWHMNLSLSNPPPLSFLTRGSLWQHYDMTFHSRYNIISSLDPHSFYESSLVPFHIFSGS